MIERLMFDKYFDQLTASFLKSISKKHEEAWFKFIEEYEPQPFYLTMQRLKRGDKFPNFHEFEIQYNINAREFFGAGVPELGCDNCKDGYLHVMMGTRTSVRPGSKPKFGFLNEGHIDDHREDSEATVPCKRCQPSAKGAAMPDKPWKFAPGMSPFEHRDKKKIPPKIAQAMVQELREKMNKPGIDWEKETEEAWELHRKAIAE